jgi:membrane protein implicated in regulation of membrane protease activity
MSSFWSSFNFSRISLFDSIILFTVARTSSVLTAVLLLSFLITSAMSLSIYWLLLNSFFRSVISLLVAARLQRKKRNKESNDNRQQLKIEREDTT